MTRILTILLVSCSFLSFSQNYKTLKVPNVDASGKITDRNGDLIGYVTKDADIKDETNTKVGHFDAFGSIIDEKSGEPFGKTDQDGNFTMVKNKKVISWKSFPPENGMYLCLIKNKTGKIVGLVHKSYKQYGTGAINFLLSKKDIDPDSGDPDGKIAVSGSDGKSTDSATPAQKPKSKTTAKAKSTPKKKSTEKKKSKK